VKRNEIEGQQKRTKLSTKEVNEIAFTAILFVGIIATVIVTVTDPTC